MRDMCFSAMYYIQQGLPESVSETKIDWTDFEFHFAWRNVTPAAISIPAGLEKFAYENSPGKAIQKLIDQFHVEQTQREKDDIQALEEKLLQLEEKKKKKLTKTVVKDIGVAERKLDKARKATELRLKKRESASERIFPKDMAPVVTPDGVKLMRYKVIPFHGREVPSKINTFNARRDRLKQAETWISIFGKKHALFRFKKFYEWVDQDGKKVQIAFSADGYEFINAACIYEETKFGDRTLRTFAMVTDEPPPEVLEAGHDRCPVFLTDEASKLWLNPEGKSLEELDGLLDQKPETFYSHQLAA